MYFSLFTDEFDNRIYNDTKMLYAFQFIELYLAKNHRNYLAVLVHPAVLNITQVTRK